VPRAIDREHHCRAAGTSFKRRYAHIARVRLKAHELGEREGTVGLWRSVFGWSIARRETWQRRVRVSSLALSLFLVNANARGQGIVKLPIGFEVVGERNRSPSRAGPSSPPPASLSRRVFVGTIRVEGPLWGLLRRFNRSPWAEGGGKLGEARDNFSARASTKRQGSGSGSFADLFRLFRSIVPHYSPLTIQFSSRGFGNHGVLRHKNIPACRIAIVCPGSLREIPTDSSFTKFSRRNCRSSSRNCNRNREPPR